MIGPLTEVCGIREKFEWKESEKSEQIGKKNNANEVMLPHTNFCDTFNVHGDSSFYQLGEVIIQKGRHIAMFSKKLKNCRNSDLS